MRVAPSTEGTGPVRRFPCVEARALRNCLMVRVAVPLARTVTSLTNGDNVQDPRSAHLTPPFSQPGGYGDSIFTCVSSSSAAFSRTVSPRSLHSRRALVST